MYSGFGQRNEPHAVRKYQAIQAIEQDCVRPIRRSLQAAVAPPPKQPGLLITYWTPSLLVQLEDGSEQAAFSESAGVLFVSS